MLLKSFFPEICLAEVALMMVDNGMSLILLVDTTSLLAVRVLSEMSSLKARVE
jgi:hypothetical protein